MATTLSTIITSIGTLTAWIFGLFSNLFDAITSNPYLLFSIIFGFGSMGIGLVIRIVKRVRRV